VRSINYARLVGTTLLCGVGLWFAVTGRAKFALGGDADSSVRRHAVVHVDAAGLDAVAIGAVFVALGIINLSLGIRSRRRILVFWAGAALLAATIVYGAVHVVLTMV